MYSMVQQARKGRWSSSVGILTRDESRWKWEFLWYPFLNADLCWGKKSTANHTMVRGLGDGFWISLISAIGCFVISFQFGLHLYHLYRDQDKALTGDEDAANRLLLPCYVLLFRFMFGLYLVFGIALLITITDVVDTILSLSGRFYLIQYFLFLQQVIFSSVPMLFIYPSASVASFVNTAKLITPWILVVTPCWLIG